MILPNHILRLGQLGPEESFDLGELYPEHPAFSDMERSSLQAQLAHLRIQMKRLESGLPRRMLRRLRENALTGPLLRGVRGFVDRTRPKPSRENARTTD